MFGFVQLLLFIDIVAHDMNIHTYGCFADDQLPGLKLGNSLYYSTRETITQDP